ncbi:VOC family protein [Christensenellaceae bacterium OttesenSCG-928-K19]|nr:VOC family protein [Christensenellaceae bacterium OttesenSCG-928-K19]
MKFSLATVFVNNMEASLHFYHGLLGLPIQAMRPAGNGELAMLGMEGQPQIELIFDPQQTQNTYAGFSLGIEVQSLEGATALLAKEGHPTIRGPICPMPGVRFSFVHDPNGITVQLIEYE